METVCIHLPLLLLDLHSAWYIHSCAFICDPQIVSVCIYLLLLLLGMHSTWYICSCAFFSNQQWKTFASIFLCSCWACIQHGTSALVPSFLTNNGKCLHALSLALGHAFNMVHTLLCLLLWPTNSFCLHPSSLALVEHGTYAIAPFFVTNKQFLFLHEELHNVFMLCLLTELLLVCNIADRCKGDHHMCCGSTSSKHLWEHCWGYTTGTKGLQMGKSSHFSPSLYLLWNCSRNSRCRFFCRMRLPEILSYNGIAGNSFGIIAWNSSV